MAVMLGAAAIGAAGTAYAAGQGGGGGGGDAAAAAWQAEQERKAQAEALRASRVNRYSNKGSATWGREWQPTFNKQGKEIGGQWRSTLTENLNPLLKEAEDIGMQGNVDAIKKLQARGEFQGPDEIKWDENEFKDYGDMVYRSVMDRAAPQQERERLQMETRLRQQGLMPGSAAYDRAMQNLMTSHGDVNTQAGLQARIASADQFARKFGLLNQQQAQTYSQRERNYERPQNDASFWQNYTNASPRPSLPMDNGATPQTASVPNYVGLANQRATQDAQQRALDAQMWGQTAGMIGGALGDYFNRPKTDINYDPSSGMTTDYFRR